MKNSSRITAHKLPMCRATGLDRYRDRHQARHGAAALSRADRWSKLAPFACPDCGGFHLEKLRRRTLSVVEPAKMEAAPTSQSRRYVLVDIENLTAGSATRSCAKAVWRAISEELGITPNDHVVVGGNRYVTNKLWTTIAGANIKWVVGANGPDGADRALLAAINLRQVAKHYNELVIMSGDHSFAEQALRAKRLGLPVHVVTTQRSSGDSSLSHRLAAAADINTLLPAARTVQGKTGGPNPAA